MQLTLPDHDILSRCAHTVTAIFLAPGLIEVTVFGGFSQFILGISFEERPQLAATAKLIFGKLYYIAMTFVSNFKLHTCVNSVYATPCL